MVAKIGKGANLYGVILYNCQKVEDEKGQILALNNLPETLNGLYTVSYLTKCFDPYLSANLRTEKPIRHISLNPDPEDKLNDQDLNNLAAEYMDTMDFGSQPYIVFKHTDIERTHLHIVTTCVRSNGKKISDYNDHGKSMSICRNLEKKYNLIPATEKQHDSLELNFKPVDANAGNIKNQIAAVVRYLPKYYQFQTLGAYNALLSLFNITAEEVKGEQHGQPKNGLVYFALDKKGNKISNPFKASLFGKQAGLNALNDHCEISKTAMKSNPAKSILKTTCESALHLSKNEAAFKELLIQQGINAVIRRSEAGRIYGITFVDHESRTIWNGSQLGKELSANFVNDYWTNGLDNTKSSSVGNEETAVRFHVPNITEPHSLFDFVDFGSLENLIENLGGLIPSTQGDDFDEIAFENRMKKLAKKRKVKR